MKAIKVRPAHILRMANRLSKIFPDLDFTNIVTIDEQQMQTRFDNPHLLGCISRVNDEIHIGPPEMYGGFYAGVEYARVANTLLHEVIHRKQYNINPEAKAHGKLFQKLCPKYGLDPHLEIDGDKEQELKVSIPYEGSAWRSGGGLVTSNYQDFYNRDQVDDTVFFASRAICRRKNNFINYDEEEHLEYVSDVYLHQYYQHYPTYRLLNYIVSNYHTKKRVLA